MQIYIYLLLAIAAETVGTMGLQASQQFTKVGPSVLAILSYAVAFFFLGLTLKYMPVGIVYAIWSGRRHRHDRHDGLCRVRPKT